MVTSRGNGIVWQLNLSKLFVEGTKQKHTCIENKLTIDGQRTLIADGLLETTPLHIRFIASPYPFGISHHPR